MSDTTDTSGDTSPAPSQIPDVNADAAVEGLMARVGERVRKARERKGIPRRVLSERSGVSPRYLAQLEAGAGNISIGLLQRVAVALDHRIEWLIGEEDPWNSDALRVAGLFRGASAEAQQAVLNLLAPEPAQAKRAGRICLVGLRGAGKSTLGALAGKTLGMPFVELNSEIERHAGMPVAELMALYGQEGYRQLEAEAVSHIADANERLILAVAGGIVAEPETYSSVLSRFHTIWIKARPDEHMERVRAQGDERPMAGNPKAMDQLRSILTSREALYGKALAQLDTSGQTVEQSAAQLCSLITSRGYTG